MLSTRRGFLLHATAVAGALHAQAGPDIFQAATAGDVPRATDLIAADPQLVRARSADGRTPLHFATAAGKPEMVAFLGTKGAELSAGPESPLLAAVDFPDHGAAWEMSQFLLTNSSDPNARRKDGTAALQLAQARGYRDVIEMLIHRGAASDDRSVQRVHFDRRFVQDINGRPVKRNDSNGLAWTEINGFVTLAHFNFDKVKELASATPALLDTRASWDETAIEAASHMGLRPMAEWLAERGAAVSTCTAVLLGRTAMVKAALAADPLVVNERGAHDISILGYTAYAAQQAEIAGMLLQAGASVQGKALGVTALHLAAQKGYVDLAEVLIAHGADVNASVKSRGQMVTPLALAAKADQKKMADLLRSKGAQ
jgi:ankyrin repeat protein